MLFTTEKPTGRAVGVSRFFLSGICSTLAVCIFALDSGVFGIIWRLLRLDELNMIASRISVARSTARVFTPHKTSVVFGTSQILVVLATCREACKENDEFIFSDLLDVSCYRGGANHLRRCVRQHTHGFSDVMEKEDNRPFC